jgi:membrane-bound ClpP family serine protease
MAKTLTFLHTSPVHMATFDRLLAEIDPELPVRHIVDESLLSEARAAGTITPALAERIGDTLRDAAMRDAAVVLCTCSTIGGCAEQSGQDNKRAVLRVDRPMAEQAVAAGRRILVAAALASTLAPTTALILDAAQRAGKDVQIIEVFCGSAWASFEQGDQAGYIQAIAARLREVAPQGDVIVLAQASMADAASLCADLGIPILSSPRLGLAAAVEAYYRVTSDE